MPIIEVALVVSKYIRIKVESLENAGSSRENFLGYLKPYQLILRKKTSNP